MGVTEGVIDWLAVGDAVRVGVGLAEGVGDMDLVMVGVRVIVRLGVRVAVPVVV